MKLSGEELEFGALYGRRLAENLPRVRERIAEAAVKAGRAPASVRLVAVTKGHPVEAVRAALRAGLEDLGENRVEELEEKAAALGHEAVCWHMIGHLQRRWVPRALEVAQLVHSVDTLRLAERISRVAGESGTQARILAQVNTSGEGSKSGLDPEEALEQVGRMAELPNLKVEGLMTMAPLVDDEAVLSAAFRRLRATLERIKSGTALVGSELSMGMTNDLEIAVREGSTMVRIGTALFGERLR
ncbi:MAG: YggS family pyridoxal phosphate-dependent enzyme [Gemmatimonadetes bacterium]|nr:YggS family pyridoxal phosphate-dependent enzyme [Gemmatimonadota bacterium]